MVPALATTPSLRGFGRFAPSPTGDLHVGNLRTAVLSWLIARHTGRGFLLRIEDVDRHRCHPDIATRQLADLAALGLESDVPVVYQSDRDDAYATAVARLADDDAVYECFCSRREIQEAPRAPHAPPGAYPGTCRDLTPKEREWRRATLPENKVPALRLRASAEDLALTRSVSDGILGEVTAEVDDLVLRRGDGLWAYHLAVVVDDAAQGVDQVVRGDDLASSAPRQAVLAERLDLAIPDYWHVPLVFDGKGRRLAKRDGSVTMRGLLDERVAAGISAERAVGDLIGWVAQTCGVGSTSAAPRTLTALLEDFRPEALPRGTVAWTGLPAAPEA